MKYIFCINANGDAKKFGMTPPAFDQVVEQDNFPAREYRPGYNAELKYSVEEGVHWEYVSIPPAEQRQHAYETRKCVEYSGRLMTVDEANKMWEEYQAEGSLRAEEISELIAAAKAAIRAEFPDENSAEVEEPTATEEAPIEEESFIIEPPAAPAEPEIVEPLAEEDDDYDSELEEEFADDMDDDEEYFEDDDDDGDLEDLVADEEEPSEESTEEE